MYIKELLIKKNGNEIIRSIPFHMGLNLIIDETPVDTGKETGNSVGKTTVLKLIDFCLGGDGKGIYTDSENQKHEYIAVKDFLIKNHVLIQLTLTDDLNNEKSEKVVVERNFRPRSEKIQRINGKDKKDDEFRAGLMSILFPDRIGKKPTFRQIISHNIRYSNQSLENTLLTLDKFTTLIEYASLYLFMFGCEFDRDSEKLTLTEQIREEEKFKKKLESEQNRSAYEGALSVLNGEIDALEEKKSFITINPNFEFDLDKLNEVKYKINQTLSEITNLELRKKIILEAEQEMRSKVSTINMVQLKQIYTQATNLLENVQKSFEELTAFHNKMISSKISFISKDLPQINATITELRVSLKGLKDEESRLNNILTHSVGFGNLEEIIALLNTAYEKKGQYEAMIEKIKWSEHQISDINAKLINIDQILFSDKFKEKLQGQINKFSMFFSRVSDALYGEKYALRFEEYDYKGQKVYKFNSFNTNFSTGKKQGEISCFDIAYILFADSEGIPCMHFLLNDKKELMHDNQLINISEYVNKNNIQFVASILKDKLPAQLQKEDYVTVTLSQDDKLFRIENSIGELIK
jgi:uncharacterized protein YydD (DUF2326 family)